MAVLYEESDSPSHIERNTRPNGHDRKRDFETYAAEGDSQESTESQASARVTWARMGSLQRHDEECTGAWKGRAEKYRAYIDREWPFGGGAGAA